MSLADPNHLRPLLHPELPPRDRFKHELHVGHIGRVRFDRHGRMVRRGAQELQGSRVGVARRRGNFCLIRFLHYKVLSVLNTVIGYRLMNHLCLCASGRGQVDCCVRILPLRFALLLALRLPGIELEACSPSSRYCKLELAVLDRRLSAAKASRALFSSATA